ncbi:MAG TPA: ligase-associated DNA damage response endonuclease PdeM [Bacteriovoracaceae bacterium]|nr:ligase-associated DNA damage response endonuclease PdeM [Bacteriovoracaceae bacterium]
MDKSIKLSLQEEEFIFDCRRALYWPRRKVLLTADLHWGKTQFLRNHGIAISDRVFDEDLRRLSKVMDDYQTDSLIVLGDLIHHEDSINKGLTEKVAHFREHNPCELILVKGNHDRYAKFPDSWGILEEPDFHLDGFYFTHEHVKKKKEFQFSGHLHPTLRLRSGNDELRLPAFVLGEKFCYLPAFSHLTGGMDIRLAKGERAIVLTEQGLEVFEK